MAEDRGLADARALLAAAKTSFARRAREDGEVSPEEALALERLEMLVRRREQIDEIRRLTAEGTP